MSVDCFHRLEHHCADVAACFETLLRDPVVASRFERASGAVGLCRTTRARLAVLAFLHDFGKINAGFQFKVREASELPAGRPKPAGHIYEALLACKQEQIPETLGLYDLLEQWGDGVESLLRASLAHHGRPAVDWNQSGQGPGELWKPFAGYDPLAAARRLAGRMRDWWPEAFQDGPPLPTTPAAAHLFAGLVTLADQLGSDVDDFPFEPQADLGYIERAREQAADALRKKKQVRAGWASRARARDFRSLFGYPKPRPLQEVVRDAPLNHPLLILESETGSGKTEAAILRFASLWHPGLVDGLYFAVPTRAAARQLHRRVDEALARLFPAGDPPQTVLAIPGCHEAGSGHGRPAGKWEVFWEDQPDEETRLARWAAESTRNFLSSVAAVGTVDQVLLAGLKVKWAHLRGASLARSLLVVDEVHASDAYMTELLRSLLRGHLEAGGHALLMSATLGATARVRFTDARARTEAPEPATAEKIPYPALTLAGRDEVVVQEIAHTGRSKAVEMRIEPAMASPARIVDLALPAAQKGAKVLIIRNTVVQAQAVFATLMERGGAPLALQVAGGPALHHSRFAVEDRKRLDEAVEATLGKEREADGRIVIGTQTLEQSLDIDADLLITDLCPVDVLLQRMGREHRHAETERPNGFTLPECIVLVPEEGLESGLGGGLLRFGLGVPKRGGEGIYRDLIGLEATRRLIEEHPAWTIPDMNRLLVERATHPETLRPLADSLGGAWAAQEQMTHGLAAAERRTAHEHLLDRAKPFDETLIFPDLDENVRTRLGEDGPRIILAEPVIGPFGKPVQVFNLPAHLFLRGGEGLPSREEIEAARADPGLDGGLILRVGPHAFPYDRRGIRTTT